MRVSATNIKVVDEFTIGHYQRIILPRPGRRFVFDATPGASYASVGEVYTCAYGPDVHFRSGDISLTRESTGSGTYDRISAWEYAKWRYV
jgi:hypothetical protein